MHPSETFVSLNFTKSALQMLVYRFQAADIIQAWISFFAQMFYMYRIWKCELDHLHPFSKTC